MITLESCLESILPVIKKGVIGYCQSDDGTELISFKSAVKNLELNIDIPKDMINLERIKTIVSKFKV